METIFLSLSKNDFQDLLAETVNACLKYNNKPNTPTETPDQLLTIQQAGDLLNLSIPTLYGYVHRAEIPVCKKGKRLYFSKDDLTNWIKEGKKKTFAEISAEADLYLTKRKGGNHGK